MPQETERKFLVNNDEWRNLPAAKQRLVQAYLGQGQNCVFRIRMGETRAWLTIKGRRQDISADEFEYEIPVADARMLLETYAESGEIEKIRHYLSYEGMIWEVDEFLGANQGLIVAEIELEDQEQPFSRPAWLGEEVSLDPRYSNHYLSQHPYSTWKG